MAEYILSYSLFRLNEAFAALYERYFPDLLFPEERHMDLFVLYTLQGVFEVDSNPNARSVTHAVATPAQILGLFDAIGYSKCEFKNRNYDLTIIISLHNV